MAVSSRPRVSCALVSVLILVLSSKARGAAPEEKRLSQLVEANITAVHAYQILLARKQGNIDTSCWPLQSPSDSELQALVAHQTSLLATPVAAVRAWAQGQASSFDASIDLERLLAA